MKIPACAATLAFLAACGGSGTDMTPLRPVPTEEQILRDFGDYQSNLRRITSFGPTSGTNIPTAGSSTFTGDAAVRVKRGKSDYFLIGDSRLTVNFASERMSGQASNFRGFNSAERIFNAPGQITYSGGTVGTPRDPSGMTVQYRGNLDADGDALALQGEAIGAFRGNRPSGDIRTRAVFAVSGTVGSAVDKEGEPNMTATVNGQPAIADFTFSGEN